MHAMIINYFCKTDYIKITKMEFDQTKWPSCIAVKEEWILTLMFMAESDGNIFYKYGGWVMLKKAVHSAVSFC